MGGMTGDGRDSGYPALSERTGYLLAKLGEAVDALAERALAPLGLRAKHVLVLTVVAREQLSQQELAEQIGLDRTTMVALIDDLERLGLAARLRSETDRRRYLIVPTERTQAMLRRAAQLLDIGEQLLFADLTTAEEGRLADLVRTLLGTATELKTMPSQLWPPEFAADAGE
jgi:DNA-binding MarR family transcriptional regulator